MLGVFVCFSCAFFLLSLSLKTIPLNVAYAIWSGLGTVATVIISILIWKERITIGSVIGILLIITGVIVLNIWSPLHNSSHDASYSKTVQSEKNM
ncbi:EamA family transporter [Bacillus sp. BRMEA1]|uniref:DMT family transporter n=1 Tax=Neobacillus endophyticus TaxID=2738405 RepID=UPI0015664C1D|nr:EamA family transporter [Neobacillus endophyticus]